MKKKILFFGAIAALLILATFFFAGDDVFCKGSHPPSNQKQSKNPDMSDQKSKSEFPVKNIKPGWWESSGLIYFNIPARILFKLDPASPVSAEEISQKAWEEFDKIGLIFNPFSPSSEVAKLNAAGKSGRVKVSQDLFHVLKISQYLWAQSNGDFDPTLFKIKKLWQKAQQTQQIPSEKEILNALQDTGFNKVHLSDGPETVIRIDSPGVMFDFGGIVKGYAVDRVRELLIHENVNSGLVQLGGEISTFGDNDGNPWRIGIQDPLVLGDIWGVISEKGRLAVSTSGNYEQPIIISGQSFYHIFSPKTGKPVSERVLGVTTASMNGKISNAVLDGAATAITVMGTHSGLSFAKKIGIDALILYEKNDGSIGEINSPGFIYKRKEK